MQTVGVNREKWILGVGFRGQAIRWRHSRFRGSPCNSPCDKLTCWKLYIRNRQGKCWFCCIASSLVATNIDM